MIHSEERTEVTAGSTNTLTCVAYADPVGPSINWSLNGTDLSNSSLVTISEKTVSEGGVTFTKSVLQICSLEEFDQYKCEAASRGTTDSANMELVPDFAEGM